jgi:alkyldihydroxyacetonephosphate synthase
MTEWTAWGEHRPELPRTARRLLQAELGALTPSRAAPIEEARVAPPALPDRARRRLTRALGADGLRLDDEARARHAGGQAYADLARRRAGDASQAPDAVLLPTAEEQVRSVLTVCAEEHVAVVPWGGGTSVVGGLDAVRAHCTAVVALDLSGMDRLLQVDATSLTATFQPGIRTPAAEAALAEHGLTLGHVPQSFERASLGGYVVTRSAGQASTGVGRIDDLVLGVRMVTPAGVLDLPPMPGSAAGPDLRRLVLGSEGVLGVVTELTVRVRRLPETKHYEGWMLPSWPAGLGLMRRLAQEGPHPDIARLSDPDETRVSLAMAGGSSRRALAAYLRLRRRHHGCLVVTGYEGGGEDVRHRLYAVRGMLKAAGGVSLGRRAGEAWVRGRFAAPALRDTLLDEGAIAETLETAATWTVLPDLYDAVRTALHRTLDPAVVGCHVSHIYTAGASLYFTVIAGGGDDSVARWLDAKHAANDAIVRAGGTISHHHAVGTAHRDHVQQDLGGELGVEILRAVKQRLDPAGVLNPGKLLPAGRSVDADRDDRAR